MTLEELQKIVPDATESTWHQHANGGGWVQNTALVANTAFVASTARIKDCARIGDYAEIRDYAEIGDYAWIGHYVWIKDCARIGDYVSIGHSAEIGGTWPDSPVYIQGSRHEIYQSSPDFSKIVLGNITKPLDWWVENIRRRAEEHNYTPEQVQKYEAYIDLFVKLREIAEKKNEPAPTA